MCASVLSQRVVGAPGHIEVQTIDGRVLGGMLDARTDGATLWLRREQDAIVLTTSVGWNDVATATVDGATLSADQLRERRGELASEGAPLPAIVRPIDMLVGEPPEAPPLQRVRVRNLEVLDACLVNLDRDVEPDGLQVTIAAIGDDRRPVAVRGSLAARLFGERQPNDKPIDAFSELDRWTQPVKLGDFVDGVATYELRFRGTAPEWQFDLLPDAVLDVRLGAFGHGNYAASVPVVIRPFNPLRDNLQQRHDTRFLPRELHGRFPSSTPKTRDGRWINWAW